MFFLFLRSSVNAFCSNILTRCTTIVTGPTRREACRSICKALLDRGMVITGLVQTVTNRYIEDKTEEYSGQQAWSSIGEQYPEGLTGS